MDDVSKMLGEISGELRGIKAMLERNDRDCRAGLEDHEERLNKAEAEQVKLRTAAGLIGAAASLAMGGAMWLADKITWKGH